MARAYPLTFGPFSTIKTLNTPLKTTNFAFKPNLRSAVTRIFREKSKRIILDASPYKCNVQLITANVVFQLKAAGVRAITGPLSKVENVYSLDLSDNGMLVYSISFQWRRYPTTSEAVTMMPSPPRRCA